MKNLLSILIIALFWSLNAQVDRTHAPAPLEAKAIEIGDYQSFQMNNGLTVILVENHEKPVVSFNLLLDLPLIKEGDKAGLQELYGGLMTAGTESKSKEQINEEMDFIAANLGAGSSNLFASSLKKHEKMLLDYMTDVLYHPNFPQEEIDKAKKQMLSGLQSSKTDPSSLASNISGLINFGKDHPYGEITTEETIENITRADFLNHYNTYWKPNAAYLIIIGDYTIKEAKKMTKERFASWAQGTIPQNEYPTKAAPQSNQVVFVNQPGAVQSTINITFPVDLKQSSEDLLAATIMNSILGGGVFSGRLMQNLREDKAYTYGARCSLNKDDYMGSFKAYASVRNEVTDSAVTEFFYEINRMITDEITEEEVQLVKNNYTGSFSRSLESSSTLARFAFNTYKYNLPKDYYANYLKRLEAVTVAEVKAAAQKYLKPNNAYILVVGNRGEVAEKLDKFNQNSKTIFLDYKGDDATEFLKPVPEGITLEDVLRKNMLAKFSLQSEADANNLPEVKSAKMINKIKVQGQVITQEMAIEGDKFYTAVKMGVMTMQGVVFDGEKGQSLSMQGNKDLTEEEIEELKEQKDIFVPNFDFSEVDAKLDGVVTYNGEDAYQVSEKSEEGETKTYYSVTSGLKLGSFATGAYGETTYTTEETVESYETINDIYVLPKKMKIISSMQGTMEMEMDSVEFNIELDPTLFELAE